MYLSLQVKEPLCHNIYFMKLPEWLFGKSSRGTWIKARYS